MNQVLNFAGGGIHEVAVMCRDAVLLTGHFSCPDEADKATEGINDYKAVWSSLNPLTTLPTGRILNPARLTRGQRAAAQHIAHRASLLFDFDPPHASNTMSTDSSHECALTQAKECRDWLLSIGWPLLPLCSSGSGAHLRPYVDMDASAENTQLVRRTLTALRQQFAFIDVTASDLPRLCRYYGTWNRKSAESTVERPWRKSVVMDEGERKLVTIAQLEAVCALMGVPTSRPSSDGTPRPGAQEKFVRRFIAYCDRVGVAVNAVRQLGDGTVFLQTEFCLLNEDHAGSSCGVGVGVDGVRKNLCKHNGCAMPWARWARLVEEKYGELMRLDGEIRWK